MLDLVDLFVCREKLDWINSNKILKCVKSTSSQAKILKNYVATFEFSL